MIENIGIWFSELLIIIGLIFVVIFIIDYTMCQIKNLFNKKRYGKSST